MKYFFLLTLISLMSLYAKSYEVTMLNNSDSCVQLIFSDIKAKDLRVILEPQAIIRTDFELPIVGVWLNGKGYNGHGFGDVIYIVDEDGTLKIKTKN